MDETEKRCPYPILILIPFLRIRVAIFDIYLFVYDTVDGSEIPNMYKPCK